MRETFKSLSIFSAMLMLLLMISSGCNVNFPGCGKRNLSALKNNTSPIASVPATTQSPSTTSSVPVPASNVVPGAKLAAPASLAKNTSSMVSIPSPTPVPVDVEKIAYTTIEEGKPTLWTMNTNGTERTRVTKIGTSSWHPLWSPNGKTLAFLSDANDGKVNLYIVQKGASDLVQLTSLEDMPAPDPKVLQPTFTWSPKSNEIAYAYKNQIWVIDVDTLIQTTLVTTDPAYTIAAVQWAPHRENKFIAYTIRKGINFYSVVLSNPRLKDQLTLVESIKAVPVITWSSDASKVGYLSGDKAVYTTTVEDTTSKALLVGASPKLGTQIAFNPAEGSNKLLVLSKKLASDNDYRVAVLDQAPKTDKDIPVLKYLTEDGIDYATWSPDGSKILYTTNGELWMTDPVSGVAKTRIALTGIQFPDWSRK